jgi:hypothetical protein
MLMPTAKDYALVSVSKNKELKRLTLYVGFGDNTGLTEVKNASHLVYKSSLQA